MTVKTKKINKNNKIIHIKKITNLSEINKKSEIYIKSKRLYIITIIIIINYNYKRVVIIKY